KEKGYGFSELTIILPSKRAGVFLKHYISKKIKTTIFSPQIVSIEEFVESLSQLKQGSNSELLFEFYNSYLALTPKEQAEPFDAFAKWGQILLQDFNEIDRHLIPQEQIFDYLGAIQELNHWSLQDHQTEFVKNYLSFWNKLYQYYEHFSDSLIKSGIGYQGMIYREAVEHLESYIQNNRTKHIFMGFNALNSAEETIIQELLHNDLAEIYWDIDAVFMNDPLHDAGYFARQHKANWPYFQRHDFNWLGTSYKEEKQINVIGVPKLVGQAKYVGQILDQQLKDGHPLHKTAVVLGEEELLIPVLNAIPPEVNAVNITMGLPLKSIPAISFFEKLFIIHKKGSTSFYYKDVISLLSHPLIHQLFEDEDGNIASKIVSYIRKNNIIYATLDNLLSQSKHTKDIIDLLFGNWDNNAVKALERCSKLIFRIKALLDNDKSNHLLELEYLFKVNTLFNQISELNSNYNYIKDLNALQMVYKELLRSETLDFMGEPLDGLQVMGMLESRVLDFETVIITSVNEGILPSGKSHNSFIPFDVKKENGLPTYKEKDAVYTYHFYRLLQRAKQVYILYNTEVDALKGGEKSRFITQMEVQGIHKLNQSIAVSETPSIDIVPDRVIKTKAVLDRLRAIASKGFSPSSLINYIRNPLDFYFEKILGISTQNQVEEDIAANTLGSVIHNTLEGLYQPLIGETLTEDNLKPLLTMIDTKVSEQFEIIYRKGNFKTGKNLIIFEIAKRYIHNFIQQELQQVKDGQHIEILAIEIETTLPIDLPELGFDVFLTGKVDRVDRYNGTVRVIDYKTGKVEQNKVELVHWNDLTSDYIKFSKSFQLLAYAYMLHKQQIISLPVEAGIISFKNLNQGLLKFAMKPSPHSRTKDYTITKEVLDNFEIQLKQLILEICDPKLDFIEKDTN
ncbi:MAG: PD-(D/E)XK nuclease family protein, partial [Bacteroidota bacterium]